MSGKFLNTQRKDTINNVVEGFKERIKNPYYLHNDKSATIVNYYSINKDKSTLDDGLQLEYSQSVGKSPFRYNLIKNFYLYGGISQLSLSLDNSDMGLTSSDLEGTTVVLPNTIKPIPGDYFSILYLDVPHLFEITSVNVDTMENGANFYEIEFRYSERHTRHVDKLVVEEFEFILDNANTELKPIIKSTTYDYIKDIDNVCTGLKNYFIELFYSSRVQAFCVNDLNTRLYDPFLIEFIIRNRLLEGSGNFTLVDQAISLPRTFSIDYDRTFFRNLELQEIINADRVLIKAYGDFINQPLSLMTSNKEDYFRVIHCKDNPNTLNDVFDIFDKNLINRIVLGRLNKTHSATHKYAGRITILEHLQESLSEYKGSITITGDTKNKDLYSGSITILGEEDESNSIDNLSTFDESNMITIKGSISTKTTTETKTLEGVVNVDNEFNKLLIGLDNIIIKYFNYIELDKEDMDALCNMSYIHHRDLYYRIPIIIFILEYYIRKNLKEG